MSYKLLLRIFPKDISLLILQLKLPLKNKKRQFLFQELLKITNDAKYVEGTTIYCLKCNICMFVCRHHFDGGNDFRIFRGDENFARMVCNMAPFYYEDQSI